MTSKQIERLLYRAVAEALEVDMPKRARRPRTERHAATTARRATARRENAVLEHA
jgi:hypothetical protein